MTRKEIPGVEEAPLPRGRLVLGGAIFVTGFLSPLLVPLVAATGLPTEWKAALSGLLLLGIPELFMLIAVAVLGKPGYDYLKRRMLGLIGRFAPPEKVSPARYRIGLVLFVLPLLFGWLTPYMGHLIPGYEEQRFAFGAVGDLMLFSSLFVLGGGFWDKIRGLFIRDAAVRLPAHSNSR